MPEQEFQNLINPDKYQVFIMDSSTSLPLFASVHPWIVINEKGNVSRYEIRHYLNPNESYLHIDAQPPFQGLPTVNGINKFFHKIRLLGYLEGDENSRAHELLEKIKKSEETYPYTKKYSLFGANCGTYVAWVIKDFPELKIKLPWNAFGKNFPVK